jgi:hypothetical protein
VTDLLARLDRVPDSEPWCSNVPWKLLIAMSAPGAAPPTAAAEIERILRELALGDRGHSASRNCALLGCLFGTQRPSAATMTDAGRLFAISTERVRQICGHYRRLALAMQASSALLTIVHARVGASTLVTREALEMRLGAVLGTGPTLPQVVAFCEYILDLPPLRSTAAARTRYGLCRRPLFIAEPKYVGALRAVMRAVRRVSARQGVGSINGLISSMHERADLSPPELDAMIGAAFTQMRDWHWLDKERELFWVQAARCRDPVLRAAHQIIAVAQRVPDPESLVTGIERTRWWRYALPPDAPIRSKPILLAYLRARGVHERRPPQLGPAGHLGLLRRILSSGEFAVYRVLAERRWATHKELTGAATYAKLNSATLYGALCHAPWIEHLGRGRYAIVGLNQYSTAEGATPARESQ